jgi:hypothetical protein
MLRADGTSLEGFDLKGLITRLADMGGKNDSIG